MPPRRKASTVENEALVSSLLTALPLASINSLENQACLFPYSSMNMKKGIAHEALARHSAVLSILLIHNPSGIYTQQTLHSVLEDLCQGLSTQKKVDIETEAYRLRVMLSHLRIHQGRNAPTDLPGHVVKTLGMLLALMDVQARQHGNGVGLAGGWHYIQITV